MFPMATSLEQAGSCLQSLVVARVLIAFVHHKALSQGPKDLGGARSLELAGAGKAPRKCGSDIYLIAIFSWKFKEICQWNSESDFLKNPMNSVVPWFWRKSEVDNEYCLKFKILKYCNLKMLLIWNNFTILNDLLFW